MRIVKKFFSTLITFLFFSFLIILLSILILDKLIMPLSVGSKRVVRVPDITNLNQVEAQAVLENKSLRMVKVSHQFDDLIPEGFILQQEPLPGEEVKKGRGIKITISKGSEEVLVPELRGFSLRQAEIILNRCHLMMGNISWKSSSQIPKEVIIESDPPAKSLILREALVDLVVSSGLESETAVIPSFLGKSIEEAEGLAHTIGLVVGNISYRIDESVLPETVIEQFPAMGELVPRGTRIDLVVSKVE